MVSVEPKTEVLKKLEEINIKGIVEIKCIKPEESKYVFEVKKGAEKYILKGVKMLLDIDPNLVDKKEFNETLENLKYLYQEYYFAQVASELSQHFAKSIAIDAKAIINKNSTVSIFVEMIQKYGGIPLNKIKAPDRIEFIYNWMLQSAFALMNLHAIGISHLDIKLSNIVYDEDKDLIKLIDLGSSTGYISNVLMDNATHTISNKLREFTAFYSPPEILRSYKEMPKISEYVVGKIDVYCWAATFYVLLAKIDETIMGKRAEPYKLETPEKYKEYLTMVKGMIEKQEFGDDKGKEVLIFLSGIIQEGLSFQPKDRPEFKDIVKKLVSFAEKKAMCAKYLQVCSESRLDLMEKIFLEDRKKIGENDLEMKNKIKTLREKRKKYKEKLKKKDSVIKEHSKELIILKSKINELTDENSRLKSELDKKISDLNIVHPEELDTLLRKNHELIAEISRLKKELEEVQNKIKDGKVLKDSPAQKIPSQAEDKKESIMKIYEKKRRTRVTLKEEKISEDILKNEFYQKIQNCTNKVLKLGN